ncbi:MAG: glycylpeptide N-tetradecanoyltransferase [Trizodia sp. TS-e1964]|nr:MAG: glycylpeptide N-tetradecanoyltransferase [Trizodia sp. TS-e1964]
MAENQKGAKKPTGASSQELPVQDTELPHLEDEEDDDEDDVAAPNADAEVIGTKIKKKRSKKKKLKSLIGLDDKPKTIEETPETTGEKNKSKLSPEVIKQLMKNNPALEKEFSGLSAEKSLELLKKLDAADLLTGLAIGGKNQKDMASYKFWQTQPVPRFDEPAQGEDGPIKVIDPEMIPKEPYPLVDGFEWVTMDLKDEKELKEVYELLTAHYVEDDEAMFRFNYSISFLDWALKSPGWTKEWHVGVRASQSKKLVAFISGIPSTLRVRKAVLKCSEINFLCIHKKLRSKRLAPVLIKEITRRCYNLGVWQAIYTAGVVLPKPVSSCRYYHRSLDWLKLYEVGFSHLPSGSTKAKQITRYHIPTNPSTKGLREFQSKDIESVTNLLQRYLERFSLAPVLSKDEIEHWMLPKENSDFEQVVWSFVVEEPRTHKITDFFSFYCLESSVINNKKHDNVRAAYLFYYATEVAFEEQDGGSISSLKLRLNQLMADALIIAKREHFDVFNALTLLDNPLFLEQQKFGAGDGQLHYYLYNYRTGLVPGGVDDNNLPDPKKMGGVGVVML